MPKTPHISERRPAAAEAAPTLWTIVRVAQLVTTSRFAVGSTPTGWEVGSRKGAPKGCPGRVPWTCPSRDVGPVERSPASATITRAVGGVGRRVDPLHAAASRSASSSPPSETSCASEKRCAFCQTKRTSSAPSPRRRHDAVAAPPARRDPRHVADEPDAADHGRRRDRPAAGLVVERDVARRRPGCRARRPRARCPRSPGASSQRDLAAARGCRS